MSCILPHKQAILNFSQDLSEKGATKPGIPWVVQDYSKSVVVIKEFEDSVRYYFPNEFDMSVAEIKKTETKLEWGSSYRRDNIKTTYRVIPNKEFLDKLDAKRKELGIYDSKLSLSDYFEDLQEQYDIIDNKEIKPGVPELFESNPELANAVYEALGFEKEINSRLTISQEGSDGFGYVLGLFDNKSERIGKIVYRNKTYLKDKGFPNVNELHLGFEENYQGKGYFQDALIELLNYDDSPIFISNGRVINDNVFKAINKLDTSKLNINKIEDGYIITLNNELTPQQKQQAQQLYSQYLDTIFPDSKVKDIVYHGTDKTFEQFSKKIEKITDREIPNTADAYFFTNDLNRIKDYGKNKVNTIINSKEPLNFKNISNDRARVLSNITYEKAKKYTDRSIDSVIADYDLYKDYIVFEPEQIHILGSKQDIEGFREFVEGKPIDSEFASEIKESVQFIQEQILSPEMVEIIKNNHPQLQDGMTQLELDFMNRMPNKEC